MTLPTRIQALLENNKVFAQTHQAPPDILTIGKMAKEAGDAAVIVTCIDPRVIPEHFLGPNIASPVIRNAGGRVRDDTISGIVTLRTLAGPTSVLVIHHTDCGLSRTSDEKIARIAKEMTPDAASEIDHLHFQCFSEAGYEDAIKEDVRKLRATKALAGMNIYGFSYDTFTGKVTHIDV